MWAKLKKAARKVGNVIASSISQAVNLVQEGIKRVLGSVDFVASLVGICPMKKLRVSVFILRDGVGPLALATSFKGPVETASQILQSAARVRLVSAESSLVFVDPLASPACALQVKCQAGAWGQEFGEAGAYFRSRSAKTIGSVVPGYGVPVTAFLVAAIEGETGCSLGPLTNYITIERVQQVSYGDDVEGTSNQTLWTLKARTLAHEIGHSCGLWHPIVLKDQENLMTPGGGDELDRFQRAILRSSRHVTYL